MQLSFWFFKHASLFLSIDIWDNKHLESVYGSPSIVMILIRWTPKEK